MKKIMMPLLLLLSLVSSSQDSSKIAWAFPITDYILDLNDSMKLVQVQLRDPDLVKEKQVAVLRGVYNSSPGDTVSKGYGRCQLIKGDYYYFAIGNNKSGVKPGTGDLLYTFIDKPATFDGQVLKLASHFIELRDVYGKPLYNPVLVYYKFTGQDEKQMIDSIVSDIRFTGSYFLNNDPSMNKLIGKGLYKGQKVLNLMMECKSPQVQDFLDYMIARPRLYAGGKWKISEIFATWLNEGAPAVVK